MCFFGPRSHKKNILKGPYISRLVLFFFKSPREKPPVWPQSQNGVLLAAGRRRAGNSKPRLLSEEIVSIVVNSRRAVMHPP
jgi:hypothetical protein